MTRTDCTSSARDNAVDQLPQVVNQETVLFFGWVLDKDIALAFGAAVVGALFASIGSWLAIRWQFANQIRLKEKDWERRDRDRRHAALVESIEAERVRAKAARAEAATLEFFVGLGDSLTDEAKQFIESEKERLYTEYAKASDEVRDAELKLHSISELEALHMKTKMEALGEGIRATNARAELLTDDESTTGDGEG